MSRFRQLEVWSAIETIAEQLLRAASVLDAPADNRLEILEVLETARSKLGKGTIL